MPKNFTIRDSFFKTEKRNYKSYTPDIPMDLTDTNEGSPNGRYRKYPPFDQVVKARCSGSGCPQESKS
jgi:hypothetical protein